MAGWFKKSKTGAITTTMGPKGVTWSTSSGPKGNRTTTTHRPGGQVIRTTTRNVGGMTSISRERIW